MLGDKIRELRELHDWSQVDLADKLNVTHQTISKYENEQIQPSLEVVKELVEIFGVTYDELLGEGPIQEKTSEDKEEEEATVVGRSNHDRPAIFIQSQIEDLGASFYKFELVETGYKLDYKPKALLIGVDERRLFKDHEVELAYYRTMEEGKKELAAINQAIQKGQTHYELVHAVPTKKRGFFSVQIDEEEIDE